MELRNHSATFIDHLLLLAPGHCHGNTRYESSGRDNVGNGVQDTMLITSFHFAYDFAY